MLAIHVDDAHIGIGRVVVEWHLTASALGEVSTRHRNPTYPVAPCPTRGFGSSYDVSYHRSGQYCFPRQAVLRLQPRAAGPLFRSLTTMSGRYESIPYSYDRGLLIIDPRYDTLPTVVPGWEMKTA